MKAKKQIPSTPTIAVNIEEAARLTGMSKRSLYNMAKAGHLKMKKWGHRTLILRSEIDRFLNNLPDRA